MGREEVDGAYVYKWILYIFHILFRIDVVTLLYDPMLFFNGLLRTLIEYTIWKQMLNTVERLSSKYFSAVHLLVYGHNARSMLSIYIVTCAFSLFLFAIAIPVRSIIASAYAELELWWGRAGCMSRI